MRAHTTPAGRRAWFALAVAVHLAVLYSPASPHEPRAIPIDKLVHLAIFGGVLVAGVLAGVRARPLAALLLVHAPVSELVQHLFLAHRDGSVGDAVADACGVLLGALLLARIRRGGGDFTARAGAGTGDSADVDAPAR